MGALGDMFKEFDTGPAQAEPVQQPLSQPGKLSAAFDAFDKGEPAPEVVEQLPPLTPPSLDFGGEIADPDDVEVNQFSRRDLSVSPKVRKFESKREGTELIGSTQVGPAVDMLKGDLKKQVIEKEKPIEAQKFKGFFNELGRSFGRGALGVGAGIAGTAQSAQDFLNQGKFGGTFEDISEALRKKQKGIAPSKGGPKVRKFIANAVGETIPFMAATLGATLVAGPRAGFAVAFSVEGDNAYQDALDSGASEEDAQMDRMIVGSINAALEKLQVDKLLGGSASSGKIIKEIAKAAREKAWKAVAKAGGKLGVETLKTSVTEGIQEALQETVSVTAPAARGGELPDLKEAGQRIGSAALGGAVAGGILGGAGGVVSSLTGQEADAQQAEQATEAETTPEPTTEAVKEKTPQIAPDLTTEEQASVDFLVSKGETQEEAERLTRLSSKEFPVKQKEADALVEKKKPVPELEPVKAEKPDAFKKGEAVRKELLEKAKKSDELKGVAITDVTPAGFGPEGKGEVEAEPSLNLTTEQNKLQSGINAAKTILKSDLSKKRRIATEKHLKSLESRLENSFTEDQLSIITSQKLKQEPVAQPVIPEVVKPKKKFLATKPRHKKFKDRAAEPKQPTAPTGKPTSKSREKALEVFQGTGKIKKRGLSVSIEKATVEKGLTEFFENIPEFKSINLKQQANQASSIIAKDADQAKRIAMGEETAPKGVVPEMVLVTVANKAVQEGDVDTLRDLATSSSLMAEATTMGQRIRSLGELERGSPIKAITKVAEVREKAYTKQNPKTDIKSEKKSDVKEIKESIKKAKAKNGTKALNDFISALEC